MSVFVTEKFLFIKEKLYAQFFGAVEILFLKECYKTATVALNLAMTNLIGFSSVTVLSMIIGTFSN